MTAQQELKKLCGEEWSPDGQGSKLFFTDSTFEIYLHRIPCAERTTKSMIEVAYLFLH
jgi:hypothetical protein